MIGNGGCRDPFPMAATKRCPSHRKKRSDFPRSPSDRRPRRPRTSSDRARTLKTSRCRPRDSRYTSCRHPPPLQTAARFAQASLQSAAIRSVGLPPRSRPRSNAPQPPRLPLALSRAKNPPSYIGRKSLNMLGCPRVLSGEAAASGRLPACQQRAEQQQRTRQRNSSRRFHGTISSFCFGAPSSVRSKRPPMRRSEAQMSRQDREISSRRDYQDEMVRNAERTLPLRAVRRRPSGFGRCNRWPRRRARSFRPSKRAFAAVFACLP